MVGEACSAGWRAKLLGEVVQEENGIATKAGMPVV